MPCASECYNKCVNNNIIDPDCVCKYISYSGNKCTGTMENPIHQSECYPTKQLSSTIPTYTACVKEDQTHGKVLVSNNGNRDNILMYDQHCSPTIHSSVFSYTRVNMDNVSKIFGNCLDKKPIKEPKAETIKKLKSLNLEKDKVANIGGIDLGICKGYAESVEDKNKEIKLSFQKDLDDLTPKQREKIKKTLAKDFENFIPGQKVKEVKLMKGSTEVSINFEDDSNNLFRIILIILFIFIAFMIISSPSSKTRSNRTLYTKK